MPGIVGVLRNDGAPIAIDALLERLCHTARLETLACPISPALALGSVHRAGRDASHTLHVDDARGLAVIVAGVVLSAGPPRRRLDAKAVADEYAARGFSRFPDFDGGFVVAVADRGRDRLFVCNDRLGQLPLHYARAERAFAFAPEAKALFPALDLAPRLSTAGLVTFLSAGYCLGETTLFDGVHLLEPGTLLSIEPATLRFEKHRLWKMSYEPDPSLARREAAEEALHDAILDAHRLVLAERPAVYDLLLSGGWDSRGMLGALDELHERPTRALSFGVQRGIPRSDGALAERLAAEIGVPFRFGAYDSDSFLEHASRWAYVSELANDNFGWCTCGGGSLSDLYDPGAAFTLVGDEAWGWEGRAASEMEARGQVLPPALPDVVRRAVPEAGVTDLDALYVAEARAVIAASTDVAWEDRKDFLYIHGRLARFVFPLGWAKERLTELRRPYLANGVLDVMRRLPIDLRLQKNLYRSMLRRFMPKVARFGRDVVDNHPDWEHDLTARPALRRRMLSLLDADRFAGSALGDLLDRARFEALRDAYFASPAAPIARTAPRTAEIRDELMGRLVPYRPIDLSMRAMRRLLSGERRVDIRTFDFMRRMALLSLLIEHLPELQGRSATSQRPPRSGGARRSHPSIEP